MSQTSCKRMAMLKAKTGGTALPITLYAPEELSM